MGNKIGVLLSGCGVFDGSEIHESVLTLLYLNKAGAQAICFAPDIDQFHVLNHMTQEIMEEKRNVLIESSRIARGDITNIQSITAEQIDALIIPGGFGAAKNLSNFAFAGPNAEVHPQVQRLLNEMSKAGKPIGAMCISPAILVKSIAGIHPEVTIGSDRGTASAINTMGGVHYNCQVSQIHVDLPHRIVTTPAYMLDAGIAEVAGGIEKLVLKILELANRQFG